MSAVPFHFFDTNVEWPVPPTEVLRPERRRDAHVFEWGAPLRPSVAEARAAMQAHIDEGLAYCRAHRRASRLRNAASVFVGTILVAVWLGGAASIGWFAHGFIKQLTSP